MADAGRKVSTIQNMSKPGKLLAIDGLNIVRRVYEASPEPDSDLKASIALRHALLVLPPPARSARADPRAGRLRLRRPELAPCAVSALPRGRAPMPSVLREALPEFHERLRAVGLQVLMLPEVEADDVIGTGVMRWLSENKGQAVVASTDKDLHILIAHGALVWDHFKNEWHDDAWVRNKFGVAPERLHDLLALMGDPPTACRASRRSA
jgi:protein Xni